MLIALLTLFAQEAPKGDAGGMPPWASLMPIILMFAALYFIVILPAQRRERKQRESLLSALKKNDEVVTAGGIIGVVHAIKDNDEIVLKVDDNAKLRVLKSSIVRIVPKEAAPGTAATPAGVPSDAIQKAPRS
jgi:preprotein translocase subunit YajC